MSVAAVDSRSLKYIRTITIGMGAFIATFDVTAVSLILPAIRHTFALNLTGYVWIMEAYSLAFAISLIGAGAVADRYGQRLTLVGGSIVFLLASVSCAYATSSDALVVGRVFQGVSAAFVICGGVAMAGRLYTERTERVQAFGVIGTVSGSALAIGPTLGGFIANTLGWQWVFLINIPVCLAIIGVASRWMPEYRAVTHKRLDILGIASVSLLLLSSIWFLLHGPSVGSLVFSRATFVAMIAAILAAFIWFETRASYPAIDVSLFKNRMFVGLSIVPIALSLSYWSLIVFLPLFLASTLKVSEEHVAYTMLFFTVPMFVVPFFLAHRGIAKIVAAAKHSTFYFWGLIIVATGCVCIALGSYLGSFGFAMIGMVSAGIGAAAMQAQVSGALISSAPPERAGNVVAITTVLRQGGFAVASAFLSYVMRAKVQIGEYSIESFTLLFAVCSAVAAVGSVCTLVLTQARAETVKVALDASA